MRTMPTHRFNELSSPIPLHRQSVASYDRKGVVQPRYKCVVLTDVYICLSGRRREQKLRIFCQAISKLPRRSLIDSSTASRHTASP